MTEWGKRGRQRDPDDFADYHRYLDSSLWPSASSSEIEVIEDMAPQKAVGALHKLIRWARYEPAGDVAAVDDPDVREEYVRQTVLGRSLAARCLGVSEPHMRALYGEVGQGRGAPPEEVLASLVVAMGEAYPDWDMRDRVRFGYLLVADLTKHFIIRHRGEH